MKTLSLAIASLGFAGLANAQVMKVEDVEELLDNSSKYIGKTVQVTGEVEEKYATMKDSFVLESGGWFNDEITVIPKRGYTMPALTEDDDIQVTGTVRRSSVIEIERELDWDLDSEVEYELESSEAYIVADKVIVNDRDVF